MMMNVQKKKILRHNLFAFMRVAMESLDLSNQVVEVCVIGPGVPRHVFLYEMCAMHTWANLEL